MIVPDPLVSGPLIPGPLVVSLLAPTLDAFAAALDARVARHADIVELRLDQVADEVLANQDVLATLIERAGRPVIVAIHGAEGFGVFEGDVVRRRDVLSAAARSGAAFVDVDERFATDVGDLGVARILSTHRDVEGIEALDTLVRSLDAIAVEGRDLVKVVPPARTAEEGLDVLRWLATRPAGSTIAFCSGEVASFTRLLAPSHGSVLVYAAPDVARGAELESAAPGQPRASHVRAVWAGRAPSRDTVLAAVCGRPITHSASPVVHGAALRVTGVDGMLVPIAPESLAPVLTSAVSLDGPPTPLWCGLSVTAPFKLDALQLADRVAAVASAVGAANTLTRAADGALVASNTDAPAVRAALEAAGAKLDGCQALVIGAGGAARAAVQALKSAGAVVTVAARRREAAAALDPDRAIALDDETELGSLLPDVIVHTTPLGTDGAGVAPVPDALLRPGVTVLDAVYRPRRTDLLRRAAERGATPIEGSAWFLHQAWLQHLLLFEHQYLARFGPQGPPEGTVRSALAAMDSALAGWLGDGAAVERPRVVTLVGLRCAGKTTVGRALAEALGMRFIDLDEAIAEDAGVPHVATLIERDGLDAFRRLEELALAAQVETAGDSSLILSTGGGAVESDASCGLLEDETFCVWLRAPLPLLRARMAADQATPRPQIVAEDESVDEFEILDRRRAPFYARVSRLVLDVEEQDTAALIHAIDLAWAR